MEMQSIVIKIERVSAIRKYRTQEQVPWGDILDLLHWYQKMNIAWIRLAERRGRLTEDDPYIRNLRTGYKCSRGLHRFLGYGETKTEREAAELLNRL